MSYNIKSSNFIIRWLNRKILRRDITKIGKELVYIYGRRKSYSINEIEKVCQNMGYSKTVSEYALVAYSTEVEYINHCNKFNNKVNFYNQRSDIADIYSLDDDGYSIYEILGNDFFTIETYNNIKENFDFSEDVETSNGSEASFNLSSFDSDSSVESTCDSGSSD